MNKTVYIIGAGPGGIYAAYELKMKSDCNITIIESGKPLDARKCPINGTTIKSCIHCNQCSIMTGFGGAGAFSDGKYNITNEFGGNLCDYIGIDDTIDLLNYVDKINIDILRDGAPKLYSTANSKFKDLCLKNDLHLLNANVRHLGTDKNYEVLKYMYEYLVTNGVDFKFNETALSIDKVENDKFQITTNKGNYQCDYCIVSVGRSGSKWMQEVCEHLELNTISNSVDIGVRVELPYEVFSHLTDDLYESKIVYRTQKYQDKVRTFCMNPKGAVVSENTNGIVTVNGHSYEDPNLHTNNTNFALLVSKSMTKPFNNSNEYGESIARLSNMLGNGVIVQRFGDLLRYQRSTEDRINKSFTKPTLKATPGDLSLVLPKRILDDIIEMIYALDKIAPGTASDDTLLYGVEVKFYNMVVEVDNHLETSVPGLYVIGDGSGVTHSLSHASASGVYVARDIINKF